MNRRSFLAGGAGLAIAGVGAAFFVLRGMGSMEEYNASIAATRAALRQAPETNDLIRYATLAANSHNTQPWRFRISAGNIEILPDMARQIGIVDPDNHHLFASLGCAAENLAIACGARGRPGALRFNPAENGSIIFATGGEVPAEPMLFNAIPQRQSTRGDFDGKPVSTADLRSLVTAAAMPGVDLVLLTDRPQIERVRDLVLAGNSAQLADPAFLHELKAWLRFNPRQAMRAGDGLLSASSGNPSLPSWLGPMMFDLAFKAEAENEKYARQFASTAGVAVFVAHKDDRAHWVLAGRACQRFALQATALGLKHAFINQPVEVASLRPELATLVGLPGRRPDIVMRFGYGPSLPYSARRPVEAVLA
ncbi:MULTISPECIES: Acg family FMN-binding oxidoreductase [Roseomonadaceae]|uniref:Nitroreductase family protein n=1 Tax=Falsiroseomonas oleicola TaxID=2801474 RepID=A0ABS6HE05_9PROT|nr:nitroreductase family protein [Roseomonas oleicola]MBU8546924.1 nitroreductase family protein [Roseomonas oleicola]